MFAMTAPQAKHAIKWSLIEIFDPAPKKKERLDALAHFDQRCAYCGKDLKNLRSHLDHLQAGSKEGRNHISNRVPACQECNGNEKLARDWKLFLKSKCGQNKTTFKRREARIKSWVRINGRPTPFHPDVKARVELEIKRVSEAYSLAVRELRFLKATF